MHCVVSISLGSRGRPVAGGVAQVFSPSRGTGRWLRSEWKGAVAMEKWKVGIAGLRRGSGFVSLFAAHPRVEVVGLCDVDEAALGQEW